MPYKNKEEKERRKQRYLDNKEKLSAKAKERYLKNSEKIKAQAKKRYLEKKEEIIAYQKEYYTENKAAVLEQQKTWVSNNKEKVKEIKARYRKKHIEKLREDGRKYSKDNREKSNVYKKKWRALNPQKIKEEKLKGRFKITLSDYESLLKNQNNCCGICGTPFDTRDPNQLDYPCVDHDHGSKKKIRGILCRRCNSGIGNFYDNPIFLKRALSWIKRTINIKESNVAPKMSFSQRYYYSIKTIFKINKNQYWFMLENQNNKCGICQNEFISKLPHNPCIDHSHDKGHIRGLLCGQCNRALGLLKDDPVIIESAIEWIIKNKGETV